MKKKMAVLLVLMAVLTVVLTSTAYANGWRWGTYKGFPVVKLWIEGHDVNSDVPAIVMDGRTLVPIRLVSEEFGAHVDWDEAGQKVYIDTPTIIQVEDLSREYDRGYGDGYNAGYNDALANTTADGTNRYDQGWNNGYRIGYEDGRKSVGDFNTGYNVGYENGYQAGLEKGKTSSSPVATFTHPIGIRANVTDSKQLGIRNAVEGALDLLRDKSPSWYQFVTKWVKFVDITINQGKGGSTSALMASQGVIEVTTANPSDPVWIASILVHEATHVSSYMSNNYPYETVAYANQKKVLQELDASSESIRAVEQLENKHPWDKAIYDLFN